MRTIAPLVGLVLAATALSGCAGGDQTPGAGSSDSVQPFGTHTAAPTSPPTTQPTRATASTPATPSASATVSESATASPTEWRLLTQSELSAALLTDAQAGEWASSQDSTEAENRMCHFSLPEEPLIAKRMWVRGGERDDQSTGLAVSMYQFSSPEVAEDGLASIRAALGSCNRQELDNREWRFRVIDVPVGHFAGPTLGVEANAPGSVQTIWYTVVGNVVARSSTATYDGAKEKAVALGTPTDPDLNLSALTGQVANYEAAATSSP